MNNLLKFLHLPIIIVYEFCSLIYSWGCSIGNMFIITEKEWLLRIRGKR